LGKRRGWLLAGVALARAAGYAAFEQQRRAAARRLRNHDTRVLVLGAGACGSALAARLALSGMQVALLTRGARFEELHADGLRVQSGPLRRPTMARVELIAELPPIAETDLALISLDDACLPDAPDLLSALPAEAPVLLLLGSDSLAPTLETPLASGRTIAGLAPVCAVADGGGVLRAFPGRLARLRLGEWNGASTQRLHQVLDILRRARVPVEVDRHIAARMRLPRATEGF